MKVQLEDVSQVEKRLSVEIPPEVVEKELSLAYRTLAGEVKLPGFRPGKVPRRILEQRYRAEVESDVSRRLQLNAVIDAVRTHQVPLVGDPRFSAARLEAAKPFSFTATLEVKPTLTVKDHQGLPFTPVRSEVSDAEVDAQLGKLQDSRAQHVPVTGRTVAQAGDQATIDYHATRDGQPLEAKADGVAVELTPGELVHGFMPQLEGLEVGAQKSFDYAFPQDYPDEKLKGQVATFHVTLKGLKVRVVPTLDDAFAESLGVENLAALRSRIRKDLERSARNKSTADERTALIQALLERNQFPVPPALVEQGVTHMLQTALGSMSRSGIDPAQLGLDWTKLKDELRPRAEVEVRGQLLLEAIARQEGITVEPADLEARMSTQAADLEAPLHVVRKQYQSGEARAALTARVQEEKVLAWLKAHAAPPSSPSSP